MSMSLFSLKKCFRCSFLLSLIRTPAPKYRKDRPGKWKRWRYKRARLLPSSTIVTYVVHHTLYINYLIWWYGGKKWQAHTSIHEKWFSTFTQNEWEWSNTALCEWALWTFNFIVVRNWLQNITVHRSLEKLLA